MISHSRSHIAVLAMLVAAGCTEPRPAEQPVAPAPPYEARLDLSDVAPRAGAEIVVSVRLRGTSAAQAASFTERVTYDSAGLRYLGDVALSDGAARVTNAAPGLIRSAGVRAEGFVDGTLIAYRFSVVDPGAVARIRLTVDELHSTARGDATSLLRVVPAPVVRAP